MAVNRKTGRSLLSQTDPVHSSLPDSEAEEDEIRFEKLLRALTEMATDPRILMARVLLSVLFLISDGLLYAEQDVDTKQIFIMFPVKASA